MPLYEYRCTSCEKRLEVLQRVGEAPLTECPSCHGALERLISAPALQFKGSGFYITDYGRSGSKGTSSSAGEGSAPAAKAEGKTESKSESTSTNAAPPAAKS
ncbi:MAG: FmdB family zinc ribbon protein [Acidobacteriota bacterium]